MTKEQAEFLTDYGGEIHENYSGRGMYGDKTDAVVFDSDHQFHKAIAEAIRDCVADGNMEGGELLYSILCKLQTDNLGLSIIYY